MLQTLTITSPAAMPGSWLTEIARDAHHRRAATEWSASAAWGTCTRQCPEAVLSTDISLSRYKQRTPAICLDTITYRLPSRQPVSGVLR